MNGVERIAAERARHTESEGWTPDHDDQHTKGELAQAAACYAWPPSRPILVKKAWPWEFHFWKPEMELTPEARIRVLEKAGALIAAEIDRLLRLAGEDDR